MSWKFWLIIIVIIALLGLCLFFLPMLGVKAITGVCKGAVKVIFTVVKGLVVAVSKIISFGRNKNTATTHTKTVESSQNEVDDGPIESIDKPSKENIDNSRQYN